MSTFRALLVGTASLFLVACEPPAEPPAPNPLEQVPQTSSWTLGCLTAPVHVVRTNFNVPHIYAEQRTDLACAMGFVTAQDRFFQMDLIARNGLGLLSEVLGDAGLSADIETRSRGGRQIADQMLDSLSSEDRAVWEAYTAGVNAYIDGVRGGQLPAPAEAEILYLLLGLSDPAELLDDWTPLHIAGVASTVNYVSGFETTDIRNQQVVEALETYGEGLPQPALRHAGAVHDVWENIVPVYPVDSSAGFGAEARGTGPRPVMRSGPKVEAAVLDRAIASIDRMEARRIGRPDGEPFGSNTWAVGPQATADGSVLVAGDGHLALTSPAFLYQTHLDTELLGGGPIHMHGLTVAGAPMIGLGTNGDVAWSHTSQVSDINDYYRDEIVVDEVSGRPTASIFQGDELPLEEIVEAYEVSDTLGSVPGTREVSRWLTAQGRPIFSLEGEVVDSLEDNAAAVNIFDDWIVASDVDGDGVITAITGAATHFSERHMVEHVQGWAEARNVDEWASHLHGMTSYSQHFVVGDADGNILYTGFQGMPCRGYLPRDGDGVPLAGANPQLLIDGSQYPSFQVLYDDQHRIDPAKDSELNCTISAEEYPHAKNPDQGYLLNSNNASWSAAWDGNLWNEPYYIGGPWYGTWRGSRIEERLEADAGSHSIETMSSIHGDHKSRMATEFLHVLLDGVDTAAAHAAAGETDLDTSAGRMAELYTSNQEAIDEARSRLEAWQDRGLLAASGVETWYDSPTEDERADAVATMIWNAWMGRFLSSVWDDEQLPSVFRPTGSYGRTRALKTLVDGVGPDGAPPASLDPETGESVFFDVVGTDAVETRAELSISALVDSLSYLQEPFESDRSGGFNTDNQDEWLWGLKHFVIFDSFIAREMGGDDLLGSVFGAMEINPEVLPLVEPEPGFGDPRRGLPGFPRPGDAFSIDAAGGIGTHNFRYGSGPVMRMVISLGSDGVQGTNIIPGGQAADPNSPHFADQAELWIANEADPIHFYVDDVIAAASGRELLTP